MFGRPNQNNWDKMLPESSLLGKYFHELFRIHPEQQRRRSDWKKGKKGKSSRGKEKRRPQIYGSLRSLEPYIDIATLGGPPEVESPCNASWFAVFASIRQAVLDRWMKHATQVYLASSSSAPPLDGCSDVDSDLEDVGDHCQDVIPIRVPKVVDIGLRSVFEIIRESRTAHPVLCTKALFAILDVLQGQQPDGLKGEPIDIVDPLFDLLLDLATSHGPEPDAVNDGSHLTAVACACLLSLVVVRGDTGKLLNATGALLMCPRALATQNIQMPLVMTALQRSVHGVLLGKTARPDWLTHGVPLASHTDTFIVKMSKDLLGGALIPRSLASDGEFLYLYTSKGLLKIGSGYRNTMKGLIYQHAVDFFPDEKGWLSYANGKLYFKRASKRSLELLTVDRNGLYVTDKTLLNHRDLESSVFFSDGECLGMITSAKDDGFVVRMLNPSSSPIVSVSELPLKLARKCLSVCGAASYDEDSKNHSLLNAYEEDVAAIIAGKDFGLIRTSSGKVLYCGKPASLGIKQPGPRSGKWVELPITKSPKIVHIAVGHDGLHAILVTEDGCAFFTGTARRGEDGDQSKTRRQPKAVKPKKMTKVDGQHVVYAACNNGTTALITKEGELLMFGKDTSHCDPITGHVTELKDIAIIQVALGKAHAVALSSKGHVYTFGINNKGQCGRDFSHGKEALAQAVVAMETTGSEDGDDNELDWEDIMCSPGKHKWRQENCMVCTVCRECTGYSISCLSSMRPDRNPGQECGCGEGDSGCEECGCCRICARENIDNSELAILGPSGAGDIAGMMRLDLIFRGCHGKRLQDHLHQRLEERKQRQLRKASSSKHAAVPKLKTVAGSASSSAQSSHAPLGGPVVSVAGSSRSLNAPLKAPSSPFRASPLSSSSNRQVEDTGGEGERDASRATSLPPTRLYLPTESPVIQIACGLHHSAVLTQSGDVFTFGDNLYGQLGVGDPVARSIPGMVRLPFHAVHIACGSYHTVVLTVRGEVITFGNHSKGQLGRPAPGVAPMHKKDSGKLRPDWAWYATPDKMPHIGPRHGRRATWVGASGDQTFLRIDESLINSSNLAHSTVMANKASIILAPSEIDAHSSSFRCLVINRRDGNCNSYSGSEQVDFSNTISCLDPLYNVVWCYQPGSHAMVCYNVVSSETRVPDPPILSPELALPVVANCFVTRAQAALHLLCCLDTLTRAHEQNMSICEDASDKTTQQAKVYSREDFSAVSRFESHGGGWGYSAHSIEAIRFMADTDILLGGFGLFGGRGEYTGKIKLFDIGVEGGEQETDGELLAETEEIPYECGPRQKYPMLFDEPIPLQANRWYVAWARISGPSSDCGSSGQGMVTTEDQVIFYFKSSKKSNNGTDNNAGQIPQILYRVVTPENHTPNRQVDQAEPVFILSRDFSRNVSKECFESLLALLSWSWNTLKVNLMDISGLAPGSTAQAAAMIDLRRLMYISRSSLRLLCSYTNEIYPNQVSAKKLIPESVILAECVGDVRALLRQILSDSIPTVSSMKSSKSRIPASVRALPYSSMIMSILEECHQTFVSCFHAIYPTAFLKWTCLCDLLAASDKRVPDETSSDKLLSAVLAALCSPTVRLRSTFPILSSFLDAADSSLKRQLSPSDNTGLPMMPCIDSHHYPILVEQMSYRSQLESCEPTSTWVYRDVLERLLDMISVPVRQELCQERVSYSSQLVLNCCHLLARVVAELSSQSSGGDEDLEGTCGRVLHTTPSRFTRINQSRTWNTGNGSPDAVCFSVDRSGVVIAGVTVYGGMGNYEYELELLDDVSSQNNSGNDPSHTQRWNSLELTRGTFGPDDCVGDVAELKFDKPVTIKEGVKYAVRLRNHGGRTSNGDGGLRSVKGPDGATFSFSTCSLSFNGTTQTRGQIPQIMYYSNPQDSENQQSSKALLELQARKATLSMASAIVQRCSDLLSLARERAEDMLGTDILSAAPIITTLMPLCIAHISYLAFTDPRSAVQVLGLVQELLPHIAALNLLHSSSLQQSVSSQDSVGGVTVASNVIGATTPTTSQHYAWVESEHPYKQATVSNYRVLFPENVKWLAIEFDPQCGTAQAEDTLQLYIPSIDGLSHIPGQRERDRDKESDRNREWSRITSPGSCPFESDPNAMFSPHWPVLHKFSGSPGNWPQAAIILPGNEVIFSLETASDYIKDDKACFYGFRCLVIGYEWTASSGDGLRHLEGELAFIGGMCAASLMKKDLLLPALTDEMDEDLELVEEQAHQVYAAHSALLGKGFALASAPTINQALDGVLPFSCLSNERQFLRDLVQCSLGTSGGRLARWLQPDPFVDTGRCGLLFAREDLRQGWPAVLTAITRDQYGDVVHVPYLKVDAKAIPIDKREAGEEYTRKVRRVSEPDEHTFGGHAYPSLDVPYEITIKDKTYCHAITMMKAYENYSFEELRFISPAVKRSSETMLVRPHGNGTYSVTWTPASVGWYSLMITIDGYVMDEIHKVEVKETPQGLIPPKQSTVRKQPNQPSRLRKFVAKKSAGLRIRAHPSLQSEQIGVVPVNGTISFIDEIHNDDGVWLRLNVETIRKYCSSGSGGSWGGGVQALDLTNDTPPHRVTIQEAWCLQYNQHLGKTLLLPVEDPKTILDQVQKDAIIKRLPDLNSKDGRAKSICVGYPATYHVVKCGASGHNVRSRPNLKAPPVGMLVLGNTIDVVDHVVTLEGSWVQLEKSSMSKFCFNSDGEAWSLAHGRNGAVYLQAEDELFKELCPDVGPQENVFSSSPKKGFDFAANSPHQLMTFGSTESEPSPAAPFKFQPTSPPHSPGKSTPKHFWDDPVPSNVPHDPFVFGSQSINQQNTPPPKAAPRTSLDKHSSSTKATREFEQDKENVRDRRQSGDSGKFASLQRWLKGDDTKRTDRPSGSASDVPPELVGVSVKDLVKALGDTATNGNGTTPPSTPKRMSRSSSPMVPLGPSAQRASLSSSPVPIPGRVITGLLPDSQSSSASPQGVGSAHSVGISPLVCGGLLDYSPQRRGSTQSDTSALISSLTRDPSSTSPGNTRDLSPGPSASSSCSMQSEGSAKGIPAGALLARQIEQQESSDNSSKSVSQAGTQTSPEGTTAVKTRFNIGAAHSTKDDSRLSPKLAKKGERGLKSRGGKRAISPSPGPLPGARDRTISQPVKEAISPSVAESLRAVFASFLWHEGIVHDAMACASFLKFHPNLPKQGAVVVTRAQPVTSRHGEKIKQRHSVEVTNAGSYLHIQPATLESLTRSAANANANRSRSKKPQTQAEAIIREEYGIPGTIDGVPLTRSTPTSTGEARSSTAIPGQTVAVLPPALKALVILWEQLSTSCLHAISNQTVFPSPNLSASSPARSLQRLKQKEKAVSFKDQDANKENKETKKSSRKKKEWRFLSGANAGPTGSNSAAAPPLENETVCELCGNCYPHPVTYHMRVAHPGCGAHAGGKGYNSGGNFCVGWAGNCGDGGIGGSSWYLVCDACRDRYLRTKKTPTGQGQSGVPKKSGIPLRKRSVYSGPGTPCKMLSPCGTLPPQDVHIVMRNNAMFLLELASAAGSGLQLERRPSPSMPPVAEHYSSQETLGPFNPVGPFQCLSALGANPSQLRDDSAHIPYLGSSSYAYQSVDEEHNGNGHSARGARPMSEFYSDSDGDGIRGRGFHRSVSMGTNGASWSRREGDGRIIMMRRRNNSSSEVSRDGGSYLLCYPSAALQKLVPNMDRSAIVSSSSVSPGTGSDILSRPVMAFLFQQHNLDSLQFTMKQALRKATCRVYAMQALNWLLHNVTQPVCLHDLLWWLVAALTSACQDSDREMEDVRCDRKDDMEIRAVCEHPLSDISIAGDAVHPLPSTFHALLQSVADLMLLLPPGSALQQIAVQCWGLRFTPQDHMFLHRSQVFSNISKILSHSEEEQDDLSLSMHESHLSSFSQITSCVETLKDLTSEVDIKASSRQAMIVSLTDNSTETFWESGDEDRNKTKIITITCDNRSSPRMIYIHIDNCRDLANKVSSVIFLSGQTVDELYCLQQVEVENRSTGWIRCPILDAHHSVIRLELKGPDNSLRLRQVRILGEIEGESTKMNRQHSALTIQQRNCESETLRVFRLITGQVFGKLLQQQQQQLLDSDSQLAGGADQNDVPLSGVRDIEESNDLKEHMVGILFSRSKLSHLQKQVVIHIVQAIRKEALHVREEWEVLLCSPPNAPTSGLSASFGNGDMMKQADAYCFEMLSMVLALSGSSVGKAYLAQQHGLLRDVLSLLHTGSARVQRQVTSLLRRMLPEVAPLSFGCILNIDHLPPADFSIVTVANKALSQTDASFDVHKISILDVFLSCIAKALTVQVKVKGKEAGASGSGSGKGLTTVTLATSIHPRDFVGARWWLRGCMTRKLAEVIIQLLKDMAAGKLSDAWAEVTKGAIAENILNLTRLGETERTPSECLRTPTLWLALAALCVLDSDHVERLSSGEWRGAPDGQPPPPRPTCSNHDDGETGAIIQCSVCGNLCADCDRFLHLHRRTRMHQRQVCKEEEEAIKVDLHEGCGRTKLFWVMALADSCTLKAMVEFRERRSAKSANFTSGTCRFCGTSSNSGLLAISNVCADQECQEHAKNACTKHNPCGHVCGGIVGETVCLSCLHGCSGNPILKQDADDMCMICFTEALSCAPAIQLSCGHVFHLHCCQNVLRRRWPGPRITFSFSQCPICKAPIEHQILNDILIPVKELLEDVRRKALMRLEYEGLHQTEAITTLGARFYNDPAAYAMDRYAYYVCYKCNKAYYGGEARCDAEMGEQYDPTELVCGGCSDVTSAQMCPKHGTDFLEYKCRYCCSVAVFFCFGSTHFCNPCHDDFQRVTNIPKNELPSCPAGPKAKQLEGDECPLHVKHPPTGEEFALGCGVCRNAHTF